MHENITVCAVYGHNNGESALPAIMRSMNELPGSKGLLISAEKPWGMPAGIEWVKTAPLNYRQYSLYMMYCLHQHISTEYVLTVQDDGWVLNGKNWKEEYLDYDYIGSPTHAGLKGDNMYITFTWQEMPGCMVVQNGGMSLRSKRFLRAAMRHGIMHTGHYYEPFCNEDVQLTAMLRPQLEDAGIKFAPLDLAKHFGIEYLGPKFHDDLDFTKLLGHHAPNRKLVAYNHIKCTHPLHKVSTYYRELEFLEWLQSIGYTLEYYDEPPEQPVEQSRVEEANPAVLAGS
jgi:hypothetical protein